MNPTAPNPPAAPGSGGALAAEGVRSAPAAVPSTGGPDAVSEPYPGYHAEVAALEARRTAALRASTAPLPGPLREAFASGLPSLHGFTLQPVTMGLHAILVRVKSPLLEVTRIIREELGRDDGADIATSAQKEAVYQVRFTRAMERVKTEVQAEEEALVETVFAFLRPVAEIRSLLNAGAGLFRETALREVADKLTARQFQELQQLVSRHFTASFATAVHYQAKRPEEDAGTVFTKPLAEHPKTDSAGGSPSWEC